MSKRMHKTKSKTMNKSIKIIKIKNIILSMEGIEIKIKLIKKKRMNRLINNKKMCFLKQKINWYNTYKCQRIINSKNMNRISIQLLFNLLFKLLINNLIKIPPNRYFYFTDIFSKYLIFYPLHINSNHKLKI